MGEITADQLFTVFGDIKKSQDSQTRALTSIQSVLNDTTGVLSEHLSSIKDTLNAVLRGLAGVDVKTATENATSTIVNTLVDTSDQQKNATERLNKTISSSFRMLTSSFLSKDGNEFVEKRQAQQADKKIELPEDRKPTKLEKMAYKEQVNIDTKIGQLLKEVQSQKDKKDGGGLLKFLTPFILLFGGISLLAYGAMKIPGVKTLFQNLKSGGIKSALSGLINKIKPKDMDISTWLRSLPFIGRMFDVYDAFQSFVKGDWKGGLKHLAFAIPGAEFLAEIIAGKGAKQKILAPGGLGDSLKGVTLDSIWGNIKTMISDTFAGISKTFSEIRDIFGLIGTGKFDKISQGFDLLSQYFPMLSPIADVLKSVVGGIEDSEFTKSLTPSAGKDKVDLKDVMKAAVKTIFDKIQKFFTVIGNVITAAVDIISNLGDVFSDDYGKQSAALNAIDKINPGISSMLRQVLTITDAFKDLKISDNDSLVDKLVKISKGAFKGITAKQSRFSRANTYDKESTDIDVQAEQETDPTKKIELLRKAADNQQTSAKEREKVAWEKLQDTNNKLKKIQAEWDKESGIPSGQHIDLTGIKEADQLKKDIQGYHDAWVTAKGNLLTADKRVKDLSLKESPAKEQKSDQITGTAMENTMAQPDQQQGSLVTKDDTFDTSKPFNSLQASVPNSVDLTPQPDNALENIKVISANGDSIDYDRFADIFNKAPSIQEQNKLTAKVLFTLEAQSKLLQGILDSNQDMVTQPNGNINILQAGQQKSMFIPSRGIGAPSRAALSK